MQIAIIGANGKAGENILREALFRGVDATAIVRDKETLYTQDISIIEKEIFELSKDDLVQFDVVVNAFEAYPREEYLHIQVGRYLISLLENSQTKLFVAGVGGSSIIKSEYTTHLIEIPDLREEYKETAKQQLQVLLDFQKSSICWTFLSPSIIFDSDGPRTGHYIVGKGRLLLNSQLISYVSYADYAVAVIDEILNPQFENELFTVASENATNAS